MHQAAVCATINQDWWGASLARPVPKGSSARAPRPAGRRPAATGSAGDAGDYLTEANARDFLAQRTTPGPGTCVVSTASIYSAVCDLQFDSTRLALGTCIDLMATAADDKIALSGC
jgi:hypothetical protein